MEAVEKIKLFLRSTSGYVPIALLIAYIGVIGWSAYAKTSARVLPPKVVASAAEAAEVAAGTPVRIIIPKIGVDTKIQAVGKGKSGNMAVPSGLRQYHEAGWYRLGPKPGEVGNAVIAGHYNTGAFGLPAVFWKLNELVPGDEIFVASEDGTLRFVVGAVEEYHPETTPIERVFGAADTPRLNLITCSGEWDSGAGEYTHRRVVYAALSG